MPFALVLNRGHDPTKTEGKFLTTGLLKTTIMSTGLNRLLWSCSMKWKLPVFVVLVTVSAVCATSAVGAERIVYPQAVVGPFESETYEIELSLGNRNEDEAWNGVIHLLRSDDLTGFSSINVVDENGDETVVSSGRIDVSIPKSSSRFYRMSSTTFQAGVLVIEAMSSALADIVPSFYYKLLGQGGTVIDIIGIDGVRERVSAIVS